MEKNTVLIVLTLMIIATMPSCFHYHGDNDISISISDDDDEYEMEADYRRDQTREIQVYLNDHLLNGEVRLKHNDHIDKEITLDDKTTFYINSDPGSLRIKIDKTENSEEQCERVKQACEDLKEILAQN